MKVGGQCHAPTALPPEKTRYPLYRRLCGPQGRSGQVRKLSPPPVKFTQEQVTRALDEVGSQCHAPTALLPEKTRYPLYRRLGGPQGRSGQVRKLSPPTGIRSPNRPARSYLIQSKPAHVTRKLSRYAAACNKSDSDRFPVQQAGLRLATAFRERSHKSRHVGSVLLPATRQ
jgi:hypothetical protein